MEVMQAIKTRRSIRRYKSAPVKDEDLKVVLEAARWAPSWANTQCWKFVVVRDPEIKAKLADTLNPQNRANLAIKDAPVLIAACAELGRSGYFDGKPSTDKGDWYMFDVALAMQNLVLAANSLGLGTVYVGRFDAKQAAEILQLPQGVAIVAMTPLGYHDEEAKVGSRKELSEFVFYNRYGQR
jgi:nitroreductase